MALKRRKGPDGTLVVVEHTSKILDGNALGDPHVRKLGVWLPPQYDGGAGKRARPALSGAVGSGRIHRIGARARQLEAVFRQRPRARGAADPRAEDGTGDHRLPGLLHRARRQPVRQLVGDRQLRRLSDARADPVRRPRVPHTSLRDHRGCFGKSSGGYGAIIHGMKYAQYWGAIADHSGDSYFDFVYWHDWPNTLNDLARFRPVKRKPGRYDALREGRRARLADGCDDGRIKRFLEHVWEAEKLSVAEGHTIMNLCMAATYDPDPKAPLGFRLPFNLETGELIADALEELACPRSDQPGREVQGQPQIARRHLHRLRLARPVPHSLRHADPVGAAVAGRSGAHLRGIRRQSLRRRLPDECQPAFPVPGAEAVSGRTVAALRPRHAIERKLPMADDKSVPGDLLAPGPGRAAAIPARTVPGLSDRRHAGIRRRAAVRAPHAGRAAPLAQRARIHRGAVAVAVPARARTSSTSRSSSAAASAARRGRWPRYSG